MERAQMKQRWQANNELLFLSVKLPFFSGNDILSSEWRQKVMETFDLWLLKGNWFVKMSIFSHKNAVSDTHENGHKQSIFQIDH